MGIYASSTIALLEHLDPACPAYQKGLAYIQAALGPSLALPPFFPSNAFEIWWALYHLADSPLKRMVTMALRNAPHLLTPVPGEGIAVTENFSLPDVDTTAMKLASLLFVGQKTAIDSLDAFETQGVYQCYQFEKRLSPSANVHALMAIVLKAEQEQILPDPYRVNRHRPGIPAGRAGRQGSPGGQVASLRSLRHLPCHGAIHSHRGILHRGENPRPIRHKMYAKTLDMLQYTLAQLCPDGGWGDAVVSTVEETGYAVRALAKAHLAGIIDIRPLIETARSYLRTHDPADDIPLWIGKSLYKSPIITQALQLSAFAWLDYIAAQRTDTHHAYSTPNHTRLQYFGGV